MVALPKDHEKVPLALSEVAPVAVAGLGHAIRQAWEVVGIAWVEYLGGRMERTILEEPHMACQESLVPAFQAGNPEGRNVG